MRSISFGLVVGLLLVACGGDEVKPQPQVPATPTETTPPAAATAEVKKDEAKPALSLAELQKKGMMGFVAAMNAHDSKKLAASYADAAVLTVAGAPETKGKAAIAAEYQKLFDAFSNFKTAPSRVWMKGDVVVAEWAFTGTHSGDLHGIKATEKPVGAMGVDVMWFTPEGLIKEQHTYYDMGTMMSQMGLSKQKARAIPTLAAAPVVVASNGDAAETKNVEAAKKMMSAIDTKSEADFLSASADDITWDDMTQPETSKGKAAGKKYFKEMMKAFPDAKMTSAHAWGVADFVISEGTFSGTHKGPLFGIQPTKKAVNMHGVDIMQFKDGKVVKGWSYGNSAEMMTQLGLMPQPGGAKDAKAAAKPGDAKAAAKPAAAKPGDAKAAAKPAAAKPAAPAAAKK